MLASGDDEGEVEVDEIKVVSEVGETGPILDTVPCWTGALKVEK